MSISRAERTPGFAGKSKGCKLCQDKVVSLDYKEPSRLRKFLTEQGKILSRRTTGTCADHQRDLTRAVKRSRELGLISAATEF